MTPVFARVFFPSEDKVAGVIVAFGIFAAGYLIRPLGALYWGSVGDRKGRKRTLIASTVLMALPMALTGLLPGYESWGSYAAMALLALRLVQGFAVGGETAGVIVVLLESAQTGQRGRIESYAQMVIGFGILLSSLLGALATGTLTESEMDTWGWRALYGVGAGLALIVAWLMQRMVEEPEKFEHQLEEQEIDKAPVARTIRYFPFRIMKGFLLAGFAGVSFYIVLAYFSVYMETFLKISHTTALLVTSLALAVWAFSAPLFGRLSDRVGRRRVVLTASAVLAVIAVPLFWVSGERGLWLLIAVQILLVLPVAAYNTINAVQLGEMFPMTERYTGVAITYNFGQSILGGTAPFAASLLASELHLQLAPSLYLVFWCVIAFLVALGVPETSHQTLAQLDSTLPYHLRKAKHSD
ncbi:MFS transporter, partial [Myxococcota bacterium]|nr:MFS transporter [Myxococcota bacterium]